MPSACQHAASDISITAAIYWCQPAEIQKQRPALPADCTDSILLCI